VDTAFASKAAEIAGLPALYNAWLLVGLPIALLGQAIGQAAFHAWRRTRGRRMGPDAPLPAVAGGGYRPGDPGAAGLFILGRPVIRILFGAQFDAAAGDLTFRC
jgi:putative peptidoglycan lipid II flippase